MALENARSPLVIVTALTVLATAACENAPVEPGSAPGALSDAVPATASSIDVSVRRQLAALRESTAPYHSLETARSAGYTVLVTHPETGEACLSDPTEGGMGRHYLNPDVLDGELSVTAPEALIYEPMKNGELRLVSVEYLVPFSVRGPDETPPSLFGHHFHPDFTFGLWTLHVHAWKHNPSGVFATWNPDISCQYDDEVG